MKGGEKRLENVVLTPSIAPTQIAGIPQTTPPDVWLFQELLAGLTVGENIEGDKQPEAMAVQPEEPQEAQVFEMDEAMIQAMQQFMRMPIQQPDNKGRQEAPAFVITENQAVIPVENGEALIVKDSLTVQTHDEERNLESEELPERPHSNPEQLTNLSLNEKQDTLSSALFEKNNLDTVSQPEKQVFNIVQTPSQTVIPTTSPTFEVTKTTLTWHEPSQVIRELGETITVTLEQSPTPTTKVVKIALTPETFGEMEIQLTWQEDRVEATIVVQKDEIKQQLTDQLELIREYLPKNPIVQTIAIDVLPANIPFQAQQGFQSRKQASHGSKNHLPEEKEWEEQEKPVAVEGNGLSLYI